MPTCWEWSPVWKVEDGEGTGQLRAEMRHKLLFSICLYFQIFDNENIFMNSDVIYNKLGEKVSGSLSMQTMDCLKISMFSNFAKNV